MSREIIIPILIDPSPPRRRRQCLSRRTGTQKRLSTLKYILRTDGDLCAQTRQLTGRRSRKRHGTFLNAPHDPAVLPIFAHWYDNQVAYSAADVDKRANRCETSEDTGELIGQNVVHPDVVEHLVKL